MTGGAWARTTSAGTDTHPLQEWGERGARWLVGEASAFGSGHDPGVLGWSPASGSLLMGCLLLPLDLSLLVLSVSNK